MSYESVDHPEGKMTFKKYVFGSRDSSERNFYIAKCIEWQWIMKNFWQYLFF